MLPVSSVAFNCKIKKKKNHHLEFGLKNIFYGKKTKTCMWEARV